MRKQEDPLEKDLQPLEQDKTVHLLQVAAYSISGDGPCCYLCSCDIV